MPPLRRWSTLACALVPLIVSGADNPPEKWHADRALAVSPAAAPRPALTYRLFPSAYDRKDGDAVPIYLRFAHERNDAWKRELREKPAEWNKLPLDKLPLADVKEFLGRHRYNLRQLELGARRKTAEWHYTLDAGNPLQLQLPDVQDLRMYPPLLVLKARVEMAEGRFADAIRTVETGFAFCRHLAEAPLLIHGLIGIASANPFADCLLDLIERPGAPNLYWALTAIPRPLIDLRRAFEVDQKFVEMQFPDVIDLDRPRPPAEWDAALKRIREEMARIDKLDPKARQMKPGNAEADAASKSPDLPAARKYLTEVVKVPAAQVDAMPPAEVLLRYLKHYYHESRDEIFKVVYLPFVQGRQLVVEVEKKFKAPEDTEAMRLVHGLLPWNLRVQVAQVRLERKLALLRVVEALRMHVAQHGKLPEALAEVTVVPVPDDPGTGRPFEYHRDGAAAVLTSRVPGEPLESNGIRYRVTLRK